MHISHGAQRGQRLKTACSGGSSLVAYAPLQE